MIWRYIPRVVRRVILDKFADLTLSRPVSNKDETAPAASDKPGPQTHEAAGASHVGNGLSPEQRVALPAFSALRAFEATVSCGGIRKAAVALSVDHAAVSRHIRSLEQWAGTALFDRSVGAGGQLTPAGQQYYQAVLKGLRDIARAGIDLRWRSDSHRLSLYCAPGFASEWLTKRLGDFTAKHPDIAIELQPVEADPDPGNAIVDMFIHYLPDVRAMEVDASLRSSELVRPPILAVASPDLVRQWPVPTTPAELINLPLLHEASFDQWRRWFAGHGVASEGRLSGTKLWQGHLTLAAARQGQGVALASALLVGDDLAKGTLVTVGGGFPIYLGRYMLTARRRHWRDHTIQQFRLWLQSEIARENWGV